MRIQDLYIQQVFFAVRGLHCLETGLLHLTELDYSPQHKKHWRRARPSLRTRLEAAVSWTGCDGHVSRIVQTHMSFQQSAEDKKKQKQPNHLNGIEFRFVLSRVHYARCIQLRTAGFYWTRRNRQKSHQTKQNRWIGMCFFLSVENFKFA